MKKAVGWVRVSTKRDEQATSPATQRSLIQQECEKQGWQLVHVFEDKKSGFKVDETYFSELETYLSSHPEVRTVICADMTRFSRNQRSYYMLQWEVLEPMGVELFLIRGANGQGDETELMRMLDIWMAENYSKKISRSTRDAHRQHSAQGFWTGTIPYGYRSSKGQRPRDCCELLKNDDTWPIVEQIFDWSTEGLSGREIARRLNAQGIPSPRGKQWCDATILRIRSSRVYAGEVPHLGGMVKGAHDCVIPEEKWIIAQRAKQHRGTRAKPGKFILSRVQTTHFRYINPDGSLGNPVGLHGETRGGQRYYRLDSKVRGGVVKTVQDEFAKYFPQTIIASALESGVIKSILGHVENTGDPNLLITYPLDRDRPEWKARLKRLKQERRQCREKRDAEQTKMENALIAGLDQEARAFAERKNELAEHLADLTEEIKDLKSALANPQHGGDAKDAPPKVVNIVKDLWERNEREDLQKLLADLIHKIDVRTDGVAFSIQVYTNPDSPHISGIKLRRRRDSNPRGIAA